MEKRLGRNFDENENEQELSKDIESTKKLLDKLHNFEHVLENAALTAAYMHYLHAKSQDYNFLLFYYMIRKYEKLNEVKNTVKNYNYIHMEIYTVFVHPNSILNVPIKNEELLNELSEAVNQNQYTTAFDKAGKYILDKYITGSLEKFRNNIAMGLENYSFQNKIHTELERRKELKILESLHDIIRSVLVRSQKIRCLPHQGNDKKNVASLQDFQITCIFYSLNTQLEYFRQCKKYSYLMKSPQTSNIPNSFLSRSSQSISKKFKIKGHSFTDFEPRNVEYCMACNIILWGSYPQGLICTYCNKCVHKECKEFSKTCHDVKKEQRKIKENQPFLNKENSIEDENKTTVSENDLINPIELNDGNLKDLMQLQKGKTDLSLDIPNSLSTNEIQQKSSFHLPSLKRFTDSKKTVIKSTKSLTNNDFIKSESDLYRSKSARTPSPEKITNSAIRNVQEKISTYGSDHEINTGGVLLEPHILSLLQSDDEMNVSETFEPEIEMTYFSNYKQISTSEKSGSYSRLLVLMEFHHKTKFIRMILKRFKYLLVDRWKKMGDFLDLFDSLGLNCIDELYILMKSLVDVLDHCKLEKSYHPDVAKTVYKWLTDKNDENLRCWLRLSMDLCCTNVLNSVKNSWIEHKKIYPKLQELLSVEFNRLIIIEQLGNMRPLLFNLPMIVSKIVKDLNRFSRYKNEAIIWEDVQKKLSYLPKFLDERCMPVVELVNNGIIIGSTLKSKIQNKEKKDAIKFDKFINNFPKSIFKETFIDFQYVIISQLREFHADGSKAMQSSVYIKEEIEVAVICYESHMIILQKENEKFTLKRFKSINQKKLNPWISFNEVHVTKKTFKDLKNYTQELTIILIEEVLLIQMLFKEETSRDMWFDHINGKSKKFQISLGVVENPIMPDLSQNDSILNKLVLDNIEGLSNHFTKTFDVTFDGVFKDTNKDDKIKKILESGPDTPNEFLVSYLHLLREFTILGAQMVDESQQNDSNNLIHNDIILQYKRKLKDLNSKMDLVTDYKEGSPLSFFSHMYDTQNDFSKISISLNSFNNIQDYIEYIINVAKEKVILNQ